MKILYLNPSGNLGGAERVLLTLMGAVRRTRPEVQLHLLTCADGPLLPQAQQLGVRTTAIPLPPRLAEWGDSQYRTRGQLSRFWDLLRHGSPAGPAAWRYSRRLGRNIRELAPDLVHSNGIKTHLLSRLAVPRPVPVVWHIHDYFSARPVVAHALRWASRRAAAAIAISESVARDVREVLPGLPAQVVYNAIDIHEFSPGPGDGARLDTLAGLPPAVPGTVRVGLVATYARWKGQEVFLQAAARRAAKPSQPPLRFYVIGGPVYQTRGSQFTQDELRRLVQRLGLDSEVGFIGFQKDTVTIYRGLDVVVHASTQPEPFGLTIVEAMACGKPVIASQAGGAAELFTTGHDGLGVPPADATALAMAIADLVADPGQRQRLGTNARATCVQRFNNERVGDQLLRVYDALVGVG